MVTVKKIEAAHLPEVNEALAKSLGIADATVEGLRADIRKNLEREVKFRLLARNKQAVMDALVAKAELDLPKSSVQAEVDRMIEGARADLKQRGIKDADKAPIPDDMFRPQAERRVRLGLVVAELVRAHDLHAKPEQIKAHVEELAASYEKPADVVRWYYSDNRRLAEVEAIVIENNVTEFVLSQGQGRRQGGLVRRADGRSSLSHSAGCRRPAGAGLVRTRVRACKSAVARPHLLLAIQYRPAA